MSVLFSGQLLPVLGVLIMPCQYQHDLTVSAFDVVILEVLD